MAKEPVVRRPPGEGRDLLLKAAADLFAERGYQGASTREISERAGIAETLLFRNFGSKAALFSEVITTRIADLERMWGPERGSGSTDAYTAVRAFVEELYTFMRDERGLVLSSLGALMFEPDTLASAGQLLEEGFVSAAAAVGGQLAGVADRTTPMTCQSVLAMICSMALFEEWLVPDAKRAPSHEEVVEELTQLILHGIRHRQGGPG